MSHATQYARMHRPHPWEEFRRRLNALWSYTGAVRRQIGEKVAAEYSLPIDALNQEYERRQNEPGRVDDPTFWKGLPSQLSEEL